MKATTMKRAGRRASRQRFEGLRGLRAALAACMLFAQIGSVAIAAPSTSLDARINVDFRQTALRPFLELVAQQSGRRLVMAPAADRMITVLARDTPTIDVLNDIGRRYGLRMNFENASITVDSLR